MPEVTKAPNEAPTGPAEPTLLIVARDHAELFRALLQQFGDSPLLFVLLDERCADRRQQAQAVPGDRRRRERRSPPGPAEDLHLRPYIFVRPPDRRPKD